VHREALIAALVAFSAFACSPAARGDGQTPVAAQQQSSESVAAASLGLKSDIFSGCVEGSPLVKILIQLRPTHAPKGCSAQVTPASVCVAPGGVVRFKIDNTCEGRPAFEITQPRKKNLDGSREALDDKLDALSPDRNVFANCSLEVPGPGAEPLRCDVGRSVSDGFYKYSLQGEKIEPLDPDVEVRPGRK